MRIRPVIRIAALALVLSTLPPVLIACGTDDASPVSAPGADGGTTRDVFRAAIGPSMRAECGGCHSREMAHAGLVLAGNDDELLEILVGVASTTAPTMKLVEPGSPERSFLYLKVTGELGGAPCERTCGQKMPTAPPTATFSQTGALETWIAEGAH